MNEPDAFQYRSEKEIFFEALDKRTPEERAAYLDGACGRNLALRARVGALLADHLQQDSFMKDPAIEGQRSTIKIVPVTETPGIIIGRYKLLQQIGEGGCGVVYMAEQLEPVSRRVALKVIKLGMDTRGVIARFEAERQALAMMDHPNIAKVFDAGATDAGRPYFVMELVRGVKITDYCDQNNLSTRERLDLFILVCHAVQHAHQKGIIHRDIKPSNILVTMHDGVPVPKVIDFGIAKATTGKLTDQTLFTAFEQFIGTPAYMSPEQAEMSALDIDTRSDIYSLGVLLYELLTGQTPFNAKELLQAGLDEIRRTIREQEPARPSTCLSTMQGADLTTIAKHRKAEPPSLVHLVRGDLDWIVMKALEKDRTRRYETANGLAADLKRHLENEPITARPPSATYRFQKALRRNKTAFAATTVVAAVLVAATCISVWQAVRAKRAESLANQRLADSEVISKFLTEVFQSPGSVADDRTIAIAETLGTAAKKLDTNLAYQPARRATLQATLADTYDALGLFREALPLREKVRDFHLAADGVEHADTLKAMDKLAESYYRDGRLDEALKLREQLLPLARKLEGPVHPVTVWAMLGLANSYYTAGRKAEALRLQEDVLAVLRKINEPKYPEYPKTLAAMFNLAVSYDYAGRWVEGLKLSEDALALSRRDNGPDQPETAWAMISLAGFYSQVGRLGEALKLRERALEVFRKINGPEHPNTLAAMDLLVESYNRAGRQDEALKLREESQALHRKVGGSEHRDILYDKELLARSYDDTGRYQDALKLREDVVALSRTAKGPEHPETLRFMEYLANSYSDTGRSDEALKLREHVLELSRKVNGPENNNTLEYMGDLSCSYYIVGRYQDALKLREELLALRRKVSGPEHPGALWTMSVLADSYFEAGRYPEGFMLLEKSGELDPARTDDLLMLAAWQAWLGRDADFETTRRHGLRQAEQTDRGEAAEYAAATACLRPSTNAALMATALNLARRAANGAELPHVRLTLGVAEYRNGQFATAEQTLASLENTAVDRDDFKGTARLFRSMSLFRQDRPDEARKLFNQAESEMPPLPTDETKPFINGRPRFHEVQEAPGCDDVLIWWLAYKEAKATLGH